MKLKKILPYIDACSKVILWENMSTAEEDWEKIFEGYVMDIPWVYLDHYLIESEENELSEAICPVDNNTLRITLKENK